MKKVLAWAVVLALVLSSFTMAFAADGAKSSADFKDASEIQYTEAVDVMVALGVINGFPDGTFGPQKTVQRGQMAKMIAVIMNGGEDVGDQYKSACPFADSKDHWAAGYIAYCASEHIIDGRSADVFDPNADVTGTEVAKMALTSLGYDSKIQGYTGENWAANVLKDAKKAKLFAGLDKSFVPGDPCPREAAAQILFNMLKAPIVAYDTNMSIETGDTSISVSSKAEPVEAEDPDDVSGFVELYEEVFGEDSDATLKADPAASDDFGRPGHSWTVEGDDVGTYLNSADHTFTAEVPSLEGAIEKYDKELVAKCAGFDVFVNGAKNPTEFTVNQGDAIEIYENDKTIVVEQYDPYLITKVSTDVSKTDAKNDVKAYIYLTQNGGNGSKTFDKDLVGYDEGTYVEGAVIAVAKDASGKIIASYVLEEAASGAVEKFTYSPETITVGGAKYELTYAYEDVDGNSFYPLQKDAEYTFYDYNGYVIASVQKTAAPEAYSYGVLVAKGKDEATDKYGNKTTTYYAQIVTDEAKAIEFPVSADYVNATTNPYPYTADPIGPLATPVLVAYTLENDEITLIKEGVATPEALSAGTTMGNEDSLAGLFVSGDVVAFANAKAATDTEDKWVVYNIEDLRAVEKENGIKADYCFLDNDNAGENFVALLLTEDLEEAPAPAEATLGFIAKRSEPGQVVGEDGNVVMVWNIEAYLDGADEVTSFAEVPMANLDYEGPYALYAFAEDADGVVTIEPADVDTNVTGVVKEFGEDYVAAAMLEKAVTGKKGTSVDIGTNDLQSIAGATIYYLNEDGEWVTCSYADISDNAEDEPVVYLYQTKAGSASWNLVLYMDKASGSNAQLEPLP